MTLSQCLVAAIYAAMQPHFKSDCLDKSEPPQWKRFLVAGCDVAHMPMVSSNGFNC